ncbi:MAG: sigma 54-interacting transcriptional regulator [Deltaproteobacteria bacterium]
MSETHEIPRLLIPGADGIPEIRELGAETRIGRSPDVDIELADLSVSRHHALIRDEGNGRIILADLGSANGTWRNGERLALPTALRNGDSIRIGGVDLRFLAPHAIDEMHLGASINETLGVTTTLNSQEPMRTPTLIAASAKMLEALELAHQASQSPIPVMIQGETGTGKELVARAIHADGPGTARPFIAINCAALPETLLESELFGHRKGAFTGATQDRMGLLEAARDGTVFLDEIGEMPLAMQPKLLRFLQESEIQRIGENQPRHIKVRVVAATNRDLAAEVAAGRFREDLFFRMTAMIINLPPLRERRDDIPLLAERLLRRACERHGRQPLTLSPDALAALVAYDWPGNVRELENELLRAVAVTGPGDRLLPAQLSPRVRGGTARNVAAAEDPADLRHAVSRFERHHIEEVLAQNNDNVSAAARALGVSRGALHRKLKEYGLR